MPIYYIYVIYTSVLALIAVVLVPRKIIKELGFLCILIGGAMDILAIILVTFIFKVGGYSHYGPFAFKGIPFFPPIAWSIWFILFFYFMPENKTLKYIYIFIASVYSVFFSNVLVNLGIFNWKYSQVIIPFFIYFPWFLFASWIRDEVK